MPTSTKAKFFNNFYFSFQFSFFSEKLPLRNVITYCARGLGALEDKVFTFEDFPSFITERLKFSL